MNAILGRRISAFETVVFTAAMTFAAGIFLAPRILVADAGRGGGLALLGAFILMVAWASALSRLADRLPHRAIAQAAVRRLPYVGYPWLGLVVLMELVIASGALTAYQAMITAVAMPGFPPMAISTLLVLGAWTGARHRLEGLARAVVVFFGAFATLGLLSFLLLLMRGTELAAVLPTADVSAGAILRADLDTMFLYGGFGALALSLPYQVRRRRGLPYAAIGVMVTGALTLLAYIVTVGTVGPAYVLLTTWPTVSALRTLVLHSFFLDRFGLVMVFAWSAIVIAYVSIHLWAAAEAACQITGTERGRGWWALSFSAALLLMSSMSGGPMQEESMARGLEGPVSAALLVGWLLAAAALALFARREPAAA